MQRSKTSYASRAALDYLIPFALGQKPWDYQQIDGFHGSQLLDCTELAALALHDPKYIAAAQQLAAQQPGNQRDDLSTALFRYALAHTDTFDLRYPLL